MHGTQTGILGATKRLRTELGALKFAIGATVGSIGLFTNAIIKSARETNAWSKRLDVSTQAFSELAAVGRRFGAETDDVGDAIKDLNERIADAARGNKTYEEALRIVGMRSKELIDLPIEEQFIKVADAIGKMNNAGDQNFVTAELMADAGFRLLEVFRLGEDGIRKFRKEVSMTGEAMSEDQVKRYSKLSKNMGQLWENTKALGLRLSEVSGAMPVLTANTEMFSKGLSNFNKTISKTRDITKETAEEFDRLNVGINKWTLSADEQVSTVDNLKMNYESAKNRLEELRGILGPAFSESNPLVQKLVERVAMLRGQIDGLGKSTRDAILGGPDGEGGNKDAGPSDAQTLAENVALSYKLAAESYAIYERQRIVDEQKAANARIKIAEMEKQAKIKAVGDTLKNLSTLMNSENRKMFEVGKAAAIAQATISTFQGASNALATVPYPLNFVAAASVVAAGVANIQQIASTNMGGGGASAGGAPQAAGEGGVGNQPQENVIDATFNIEGTNVSKDSIQGVFAGLQEYIDDGAKLRTVSVV
jgi:hypothetical protein